MMRLRSFLAHVDPLIIPETAPLLFIQVNLSRLGLAVLNTGLNFVSLLLGLSLFLGSID